eukprot:Skav208990  [mRNA]  locus=scaffold2686:75868:81562:+ [translate_table: standard]
MAMCIGSVLPRFSTNLLSVHVAGPGGTALFRFQAAAIVWSVLVLRAQHLSAERSSSIGAIFYGIMMAKFFRSFDSERATLSDYVAVLDGVPKLQGANVEKILKEAVETAVGSDLAKDVVAVSVGWDFQGHQAQVRHFIDEEVAKFHEENSEPLAIPEGTGDEFAGLCGSINKKYLASKHIHLDGAHAEEFNADDLKRKNLENMETAPVSYVIFMTESARDKAVEATQGLGVMVQDATCSLKPETYEPEAILWHNLPMTTKGRRWKFLVASVPWARWLTDLMRLH